MGGDSLLKSTLLDVVLSHSYQSGQVENRDRDVRCVIYALERPSSGVASNIQQLAMFAFEDDWQGLRKRGIGVVVIPFEPAGARILRKTRQGRVNRLPITEDLFKTNRLAVANRVFPPHATRTTTENLGEMIDHRFLSDDRLVQETRFRNGLGVVVNFSAAPWPDRRGFIVPAVDFRILE